MPHNNLTRAKKQLILEMMKRKDPNYVRIIGIGTPYNKWKTEAQNCCRKDRRHTITIDSLIKDRSIFPTIVVPCGENIGAEHAFCVVDDLIFDSTQAFALILSKDSLDWICGDGGCVGAYFAVRF